MARTSLRLATILAVVGIVASFVTGDHHAKQVARTQVAKFAAMEGLYSTEKGAPLILWSLPPSQAEKRDGPEVLITNLTSFLAFGDFQAPVKGLSSFPRDEWPPVAITFLSFRHMVIVGNVMLLLALAGAYLMFRGRLETTRWWLKAMVWSIPLPTLAIQLGWMTAEVGRQPWIVYGVLKTKDAVSRTVPAGNVLFALVVRAVSLEFRSKEESPAWRSGWDVAFSVSSFLAALLFGVAIGNIMRGLPLDQAGEYAGTFFTLLNPFALAVGLLSVAMFAMQGASWVCLKTDGILQERARAVARGSWMAFLGLWVLVTAYSYVAVPRLWRAYGSPVAMIVPVFFIVAVAVYPVLLGLKEHGGAFLASSATIALLIAIMGQGLFPDLVPALDAPALSLTIRNASSSPLTLKTMLAIALVGMPVVLGYTVFIYSRFKGPVVLDDDSY